MDDFSRSWDGAKALRLAFGVFVAALVLAMFPYTTDPTGDVKILLYHWAGALLAGVWIAASWLNKRPVERPRVFPGILAAFIAVNLAAGLASRYIGNSLVEVSKFFSLGLLYFAASQVYRTPEQIRRLMTAVCCAVAVSSVYAFLQKYGMDFFPWDPDQLDTDAYKELPGTFGNPNYASHTLILCVIMAVYLGTTLRMAWTWGLVGLFLVHQHFTGQRAGIIALAAAGGLVIVAKVAGRFVKRPVRAMAVTLMVAVILGAIGTVAAMSVQKARTGTVYPLDLSLLLRYKTYVSAADMVIERPVLGYGPANYKIENPRFWSEYEQRWFAEKRKMNANTHQDILECAIEGGLLSAGLYIAWLIAGMAFSLLIAFRRGPPLERRLGLALAAFFCAFAVDGLFGFNFRVPVSASLFFIMTGALDGVWLRIAPRKPETTAAMGALRPGGVAWRAAVLVVAVLNVGFATRVFASQFFLQKGLSLMHWEAFDKAETSLDTAEQLAPWNWVPGYHRGVAAFKGGRVPEAIGHFERSLQRNPYHLPTLTSLAFSHFNRATARLEPKYKQGAFSMRDLEPLDQAVLYAQCALALCRFLPQAEDVLGRAAFVRGTLFHKAAEAGATQLEEAAAENLEKAEMHLARAVDLGATGQTDLLVKLAHVRLVRDDVDGAEDAFVRAVQGDAQGETAWWPFFQFAAAHGRFDALRHALERRLERLQAESEPDRNALADIHRWLARTQQTGCGDNVAAQAAYRAALDQAPSRLDIWAAYARFAQNHAGLELFRDVLLDVRNRLKAEGQEPPAAVEALAKAWEQGPEALAEATALLGRAFQVAQASNESSEPAAAVLWAADLLASELAAAPERTPKLGVAYLNLATVYGWAGRHEKAGVVCGAAMPHLTDPQDRTDCLKRHAQSLMALGRYQDAMGLLRAEPELLFVKLGLRAHLAEALAGDGQIDAARAEYERMFDDFDLNESQRQEIQARIEALPPTG